MRLKFSAAFLALCVSFLTPRASGQSIDVAPRTNANLLVCSWNIKWFRDTGRDLAKLAKVIAKFDLCGIIELQSDRVLEGVAATLEQETGERWTYIQSNHTGHAQYREQFAFIWRDAKVRLASGHVGNVADFKDLFRHEPYIASFRSGNFDFRLLLIHTRWTPPEAQEVEVKQIAQDFQFFQSLIREKDLIVAGDFNYPAGSSKMKPVRDLPNIVNLIPVGTKTTLKGQGEGFSEWYDHIYVDSLRRLLGRATPTISWRGWGIRTRR